MANKDLYGIEKHLASPEVSLGEHVRRRQRKLGEWLQARRAVYLDQKFWIILRDVAAKRHSSADEIALLALLKQEVASGIVFCPISESTFMELLKQEDPVTRLATAKLIDELSLGISLVVYDERIELELKHLIRSHGAKRDLVPVRPLVWSKLSYVLGHVNPTNTGFDTATETAMQKAFFDKMWTLSLSEMVQTLGGSISFESTFNKLADRLNIDNVKYAHELKSFPKAYDIELKGALNIVAPMGASIVSDMAGWALGCSMPRDGIEWNKLVQQWEVFLFEAFKQGQGKNMLRTLHIGTCLHAAVRWSKGRRFEENDFYDFHHACAALGYCDFFLTERSLKAMVTANHIALDVLYGCRVASNVKEALTLLRQ